MNKFSINTHKRTEFIDITSQVSDAVSTSGIKHGVVTIFVPHTTAGITINENADPDVVADIQTVLDKIAPWQAGYKHCEGNAAAHIKASLMGSSVQIIVNNSQIKKGTWQGIYFCEFDGPRNRSVWVSVNKYVGVGVSGCEK